MSKTTVVALVCDTDDCGAYFAGRVGQRLNRLQDDARAAGWQVGGRVNGPHHCRAHRLATCTTEGAR